MLLKILKPGVCGRKGDACPLGSRGDGDKRLGLQDTKYLSGCRRSTAKTGQLFSVCNEHGFNRPRGFMGLARNITHTGQEEFQPCFPAAMFTDFLEQPVIGGSVRLQIEAEI